MKISDVLYNGEATDDVSRISLIMEFVCVGCDGKFYSRINNDL